MKHAQVQRQQKLLPYTVTLIGIGPEALAKWKAERRQIEEDYNKRMTPVREATIKRVMAHVSEQDKSLSFTEAEHLEIAHAQKRKKGPETHVDPYEGESLSLINTKAASPHIEHRKPSIKEKIARWAMSVWRNAFDGPTSNL